MITCTRDVTNMRRARWLLLAVGIGCSANEVTLPANEVTPPPEQTIPKVPGASPCPVGLPVCTLSETYVLMTVDGQALPVKSPFGTGEWDYDEDAGTWQLQSETLTLSADGSLTYVAVERAASGATVTHNDSGRYMLTSPSTLEMVENDVRYPATLSGSRLTALPGGRTFAFERQPRQ